METFKFRKVTLPKTLKFQKYRGLQYSFIKRTNKSCHFIVKVFGYHHLKELSNPYYKVGEYILNKHTTHKSSMRYYNNWSFKI